MKTICPLVIPPNESRQCVRLSVLRLRVDPLVGMRVWDLFAWCRGRWGEPRVKTPPGAVAATFSLFVPLSQVRKHGGRRTRWRVIEPEVGLGSEIARRRRDSDPQQAAERIRQKAEAGHRQ